MDSVQRSRQEYPPQHFQLVTSLQALAMERSLGAADWGYLRQQLPLHWIDWVPAEECPVEAGPADQWTPTRLAIAHLTITCQEAR